MAWYSVDNGVAHGILWWAVEHQGHPAYYLRALMVGDFRPEGQGPLARHVHDLDGAQVEMQPAPCGTCGQVPNPNDLEPIERVTNVRGFLARVRLPLGDPGRVAWPRPTPTTACWLCNNPRVPADHTAKGRRVCSTCAAHMEGR